MLGKTSDNENTSSDVSVIKSVLNEHLENLTEKFMSLCKEDANDFKEMKEKITMIIEEFCTSVDIKKLVSYFFNFS